MSVAATTAGIDTTNHLPNAMSFYQQCLAAMRGDFVPSDLGTKTARACVVRGIRSHIEFATSPVVVELCLEGISFIAEFARARNARLIMSNEIPESMPFVAQPYCIWHPSLATEETYRQLSRIYPSMRYQVGRACAAAGYDTLYAELELLPDVSIAEEARESVTGGIGSSTIFRQIMQSSIRYSIMNDYKRSIHFDAPKGPAFLNGDTQVLWQLGIRNVLYEHKIGTSERQPVLDIGEDCNLSLDGVWATDDQEHLTQFETQLLYFPLPYDLPTVRKDLLIQMAAWDGNVDRYARLRRPMLSSETELLSVIRGICNNTMFGRWWAGEIESKTMILEKGEVSQIKSAINARRIMNNDISTMSEDMDSAEIPYRIWWPLRPKSETLFGLARKCPVMVQQIVITAIVCNYKIVYDNFIGDIPPGSHLSIAAKQSESSYYFEDLKRRQEAEDAKGDGRRTSCWGGEEYLIYPDQEPSSNALFSRINVDIMENKDLSFDPSGGFCSNVSAAKIERHVWATQELLRKVQYYQDGYVLGLHELDELPLPEDSEST